MPELQYLWEPVPNEEAARFIADKAPVSRAVFIGLLPELRARAFTIAGIESADVLQAVRDKIAEIPRGASWDAVKKDVLKEISPWLVNDEDPEQRAGDLLAAKRRAELLLRTHGFQAYQAQAWREMDEQRDVFEFWKYQSMEDARVRETHAALDGVILPHDSPFWETHFPPWEFGCRCQVVPMLRDEVEEIEAAEKNILPEKRNVLTGPALKALENGTLHRGPSQTLDVTAPITRDPRHGYSFNPGTLKMPLSMLRDRYDTETFAAFEKWAKATKFDGTRNVWDWLNEKPTGAAHGAAITAQPVVPSPSSKPASVAELLQQLSVSDMQKDHFTPEQASALVDALKKSAPVSAQDLLASVHGNHQFNAAKIRKLSQEYFDYLPPQIAQSLPPVSIKVSPGLQNALGDFNQQTKTIRLNGASLVTEGELRRVLFHELSHWLHLNGPAAYRAKIKDLMSRRTLGFTGPLQVLHAKSGQLYDSSTTGMRDEFSDRMGNEYAGRIYPFEDQTDPAGLEIPTRHIESLSFHPATLAEYLNHMSASGVFAWREAFLECISILL